jgi:hypothetical protein
MTLSKFIKELQNDLDQFGDLTVITDINDGSAGYVLKDAEGHIIVNAYYGEEKQEQSK